MVTGEFPSAEAAWEFTEEARASGHKVRLEDTARPVTKRAFWTAALSALVLGSLFGLLGAYAEAGVVGLPRLEPLFAAPVGAVTAFLAVFGGSLGALLGGLATLKPAQRHAAAAHYVTMEGDGDGLKETAKRHGGTFVEGRRLPADEVHVYGERMKERPTLNRWLAWLTSVLTTGVLLTGAAYIWFLSMNYGHGSDQDTRIGYTMKNVQRVPADTPEGAGVVVADILGGDTLTAPADPLAAALLAPVAAARGQTLVYGGEGSSLTDEDFAAARAALLAQSPVAVVVADTESAYALPAAYAAAHFRAPVFTLSEAPGALAGVFDKLILVAAPSRLINDNALETLRTFGTVERVADNGLYRHALMWVEGRWGDFGWGIDQNFDREGYY